MVRHFNAVWNEGFRYLHGVGIVQNNIKGDNVLILEMNRADMQPKIIYFNKACEVWKSKVKVIPSGPGRLRLKT